MKLTIRCEESNQSLSVETPDHCTLSQLRQIISQAVPGSPVPSSICVSRRDELRSDGVDDSLQSLGVAGGDVIFFSTARSSTAGVTDSFDAGKSAAAPIEKAKGKVWKPLDSYSPDNLKISASAFLRKVLLESIDPKIEHEPKLLIVFAIHAVMLESGFFLCHGDGSVCADVDQVFDELHQCSRVQKSLTYNIPSNAVKSVAVLKFQSMGKKFIAAHGALRGGGRWRKLGTHRVELDIDRLFPVLKGVKEGACANPIELSSMVVERKVEAFWRSIKDGLALPLLIDLREGSNLELPPCFVRLPVELKLKILDLLPGVDLARVSCVSYELKALTLREDLWSSKVEKEFGRVKPKVTRKRSWKDSFADEWAKKREILARRQRRARMRMLMEAMNNRFGPAEMDAILDPFN